MPEQELCAVVYSWCESLVQSGKILVTALRRWKLTRWSFLHQALERVDKVLPVSCRDGVPLCANTDSAARSPCAEVPLGLKGLEKVEAIMNSILDAIGNLVDLVGDV